MSSYRPAATYRGRQVRATRRSARRYQAATCDTLNTRRASRSLVWVLPWHFPSARRAGSLERSVFNHHPGLRSCLACALRFDVAADRSLIEPAVSIGRPVSGAFDDDAADRTDMNGLVGSGDRGIAEAFGVDVQPHMNPAAFEAEHRLPILGPRGTNTAGAKDTAVAVDEDVGMGRVKLTLGP